MNKYAIVASSVALSGLIMMGHAQSATAPAKSQMFNSEQTKAIEKIIDDYFDRRPEVIEETLKKALIQKEHAKQEQTKQAIAQRKSQIFDDPMSPVSGNAGGGTSIAVFMDPFCHYCHQFQKILNQVQAQRKDLRIVYKVLPFLGKESMIVVREEMAAHMQDRFLGYHEALYESAARAHNQKSRMDLAGEIGIDIKKLKEDLQSSKVTKAIESNQELAKALSIRGTPAFIINDTLIVGLVDADNLNKMLDAVNETKRQG